MILSKTSLLHLLLLTATASSSPKMPLLHPKFHAHLKCPYADQWIAKGPEQAAIDLGLGRNLIPTRSDGKRRVLEETVRGRCTYTSPFSGDSCLEFRGDGWETMTMTERCSQESSGSFTGRESCAASESTAGYCVKTTADDTYEYSLLALSAAADCAANKMACETFVGGTFTAADACSVSDDLPPVLGSCVYTDAFAGSTCVEFRGTDWTAESMAERCNEETSSSFTENACASDENTAGYCVKSAGEGNFEYNLLVNGGVADCAGNKMACETFVGGLFTPADACGATDAAQTSSNPFDASASASNEPSTCGIAPGAIGAAHQNAFSEGYSDNCPDTPAQGSPYMWPLKWAADYETQNMAFGSDDVVFKSMGRTFYRLDKNWKRSDTTYQLGDLRTIGQGPCDDVSADEEWEEQGLRGCSKNQTDGTVTTMLHKGNMMYFVSWKNDTVIEPGETDATKVEDCSSMNLQVVGNIRPDWFLDARGDDTDVQYLGNQHVFYSGNVPKLVKQWRKKDFASQYFTMGMMENNPGKMANGTDVKPEDNVKWPLVLNIPGEGFGDDMLQRYSNHELLTDEDDDLFMLIENYEEIGGACVNIGGGEGAGPPILDVHIPSNLEVDPNSWFHNEFTFSPYWVPTSKDTVSSDMASSSQSSKAITEVSDRITVESCWDESTNSIDMSIHYFDIEPTSAGTLPWMALGLRSYARCAMTPPDGGNLPMILITQSSADSEPVASFGELVPEAKGMSADAFGAIYQSLIPLEESDIFYSTSVSAPMVDFASGQSSIADDDTVSLMFKLKQDSENKPDVMYFTYAIGTDSSLGFHVTRACFELSEFPSCASSSTGSAAAKDGVTTSIGDIMSQNSQTAQTVTESNESRGQMMSVILYPLSFAVVSVALVLF